MFLSGAMMLEWLGRTHATEGPIKAAALIRAAIEQSLGQDAILPMEQGGTAGTPAITDAVLRNLSHLPLRP